MTREANKNIVSRDEEGRVADSDSSRLHVFIGNMRASLTLLESALDKPLDQFVLMLADATNKVTPTDLEYLKDLSGRLKQSIDTHAAASDIQKEIRLSIIDIQKDIRLLRQIY